MVCGWICRHMALLYHKFFHFSHSLYCCFMNVFTCTSLPILRWNSEENYLRTKGYSMKNRENEVSIHCCNSMLILHTTHSIIYSLVISKRLCKTVIFFVLYFIVHRIPNLSLGGSDHPGNKICSKRNEKNWDYVLMKISLSDLNGMQLR
jgi:hypothetical protein